MNLMRNELITTYLQDLNLNEQADLLKVSVWDSAIEIIIKRKICLKRKRQYQSTTKVKDNIKQAQPKLSRNGQNEERKGFGRYITNNI